MIQQREELAKAIADARERQEAQLKDNPLLANPCTACLVHHDRSTVITITTDTRWLLILMRFQTKNRVEELQFLLFKKESKSDYIIQELKNRIPGLQFLLYKSSKRHMPIHCRVCFSPTKQYLLFNTNYLIIFNTVFN